MKEPKSGDSLHQDVLNLTAYRHSIIEDFLHERDTLMIAAEAGSGKSVIITQLALSIAGGVPLFGTLEVPSPRKVFYLQLEGDYEESAERMRHMSERIPTTPTTWDNLCWLEWKKLDVMSPASIQELFEVIKHHNNFIPDVFIVDPIYKTTSVDLKDGGAAIRIVRFSDSIHDRFNCAVIFVHHTHRSKYASDGSGKIIESNPYYGHSFIQNHIRTAYLLKSSVDKKSPSLIRTKGRGSDTISNITLSYDPQTMTCWKGGGEAGLSSLDRVKTFIHLLKTQNREADFSEFCEHCEVSSAWFRCLVKKPEIKALLVERKSNHNKILYSAR